MANPVRTGGRQPKKGSVKEQGEQVFEMYLCEHELRWEYEPELGAREHPDYLIHTEGEVLCEVEDFGEGDIDREIQNQIRQPVRLPDGTEVGGVASGSWNPIPRIKEKIKAAIKQLRSFKSRYPCVVILFNPGYMVDLGDFTVMGAMFGKPVIHFAVVPQGEPLVSSPAQSAFSQESRLLSPNQNTTVSVVAILEIIRPNMTILDKATRRQVEENRKKEVPLKQSMINIWRLIRQLRRKYPKGHFEETHPRLRVYHNPFAADPLPLGVFRGPYDQHTWIDPKTGQIKTWQAPTKFKKITG